MPHQIVLIGVCCLVSVAHNIVFAVAWQVSNYEIQNLNISVLGHGRVGGQYTIASHSLSLCELPAISQADVAATSLLASSREALHRHRRSLLDHSSNAPKFIPTKVPLTQVMWKSKEDLPKHGPMLHLQHAWVPNRKPPGQSKVHEALSGAKKELSAAALHSLNTMKEGFSEVGAAPQKVGGLIRRASMRSSHEPIRPELLASSNGDVE